MSVFSRLGGRPSQINLAPSSHDRDHEREHTEHDRSRSHPPRQKVVCRNWLTGKCKFGNSCHYKHSHNVDGSVKSSKNERDPYADERSNTDGHDSKRLKGNEDEKRLSDSVYPDQLRDLPTERQHFERRLDASSGGDLRELISRPHQLQSDAEEGEIVIDNKSSSPPRNVPIPRTKRSRSPTGIYWPQSGVAPGGPTRSGPPVPPARPLPPLSAPPTHHVQHHHYSNSAHEPIGRPHSRASRYTERPRPFGPPPGHPSSDHAYSETHHPSPSHPRPPSFRSEENQYSSYHREPSYNPVIVGPIPPLRGPRYPGERSEHGYDIIDSRYPPKDRWSPYPPPPSAPLPTYAPPNRGVPEDSFRHTARPSQYDPRFRDRGREQILTDHEAFTRSGPHPFQNYRNGPTVPTLRHRENVDQSRSATYDTNRERVNFDRHRPVFDYHKPGFNVRAPETNSDRDLHRRNSRGNPDQPYIPDSRFDSTRSRSPSASRRYNGSEARYASFKDRGRFNDSRTSGTSRTIDYHTRETSKYRDSSNRGVEAESTHNDVQTHEPDQDQEQEQEQFDENDEEVPLEDIPEHQDVLRPYMSAATLSRLHLVSQLLPAHMLSRVQTLIAGIEPPPMSSRLRLACATDDVLARIRLNPGLAVCSLKVG